MTLDEMCAAAARYSDRYDEFEKTLSGNSQNAEEWYEDDALHYFNVFRDGINEAYREVSRIQSMPDIYIPVNVDSDRQIALYDVRPAVYGVKELLNADRTEAIAYTFLTKEVLTVNVDPGTELTLYYHYIPDDLVFLNDEPVFSEAQVEPMVYICLAVARMWYSEKKFDFGNQWMSQYYSMLKNVRSSLRDHGRRRIPRRVFR
ncbi:MAG: hypothetical protein DBY08_04450 [Clostridiales bacterium]|nr:MAG: hypothetical protein DBY08_04450 [Clostridiales bacterium]